MICYIGWDDGNCITDWALQSYLDLNDVFTLEEYQKMLRPDAELLKNYPNHPKFDNNKFLGSLQGQKWQDHPSGI